MKKCECGADLTATESVKLTECVTSHLLGRFNEYSLDGFTNEERSWEPNIASVYKCASCGKEVKP